MMDKERPDATSALQIESRRVGDGCILALAGVIRAEQAPALVEALTEAVASEPRVIVLDMDGVSQVDSAGLGAIVRAHVRCRCTGRALGLAAVQPQIGQLLRQTSLHLLLPLHESVEQALHGNQA